MTTTPTDRQARELLAAEYDASGLQGLIDEARILRAGGVNPAVSTDAALRAITAALAQRDATQAELDRTNHELDCTNSNLEGHILALRECRRQLSLRGGEANRRAIAWIVQTEHHGECYQFSDEFVERFPGAPADLTPFAPPAPLDVAALRELVEEWRRRADHCRDHTFRAGYQACANQLESILASGGKGGVMETNRLIEDIVSDLQSHGCRFYFAGPNWERIMPPPPGFLLIEIVGRGDELHDYLVRNELIEKGPAP